MSMRRAIVPAALSALFILTPSSFAQNRSEEAQEKPIKLAQVPKPARDAAQKVLGVAPTEAKIVKGTTPQQYELEAKDSSGKEMAVHVTADGTVVKKENESEEKQ